MMILAEDEAASLLRVVKWVSLFFVFVATCALVWVPPFENVCPPCVYKETECSSEYSHGAPPPQRAQTEEAGEVKVMLLQFMTLPSAIKAPHQLLVHLRCQQNLCVCFFVFLKTHIQSECRTKNMGKVPLMVGGHAAYHSHLMAFTVFA